MDMKVKKTTIINSCWCKGKENSYLSYERSNLLNNENK